MPTFHNKETEDLHSVTTPHLEEYIWEARDTGITVRMWVFECAEGKDGNTRYHVATDARDLIAGRNVILYEGLVDFNADLPGMHYSSFELANEVAQEGIEALEKDENGKHADMTNDEMIKALYNMFFFVEQENNQQIHAQQFEDVLMGLLDDYPGLDTTQRTAPRLQ